MFEYKEFEMLAQLYVERQDDTPETKAIMDRVGHDDSDTTMKIYTHVTNKMKNKVVEIIDSLPLSCPLK